MVKNEYFRYLTSKFNILIVIAITIPVLISYYTTYLEKNDWQEQINLAPADMNIEVAKQIYNGFTGISYLDRFLFSPDFYIVFVIILFVGFGIHIGATTYKNLQTGFGTLIVSKIGYKKYINTILIAQVLYISTFVFTYFIVLFLFTSIFGGGYSEYLTSNLGEVNGMRHFLTMMGHVVLLLIYTLLTVLITSLVTHLIRNKYLIQIIPVTLYFLPLLIASTIGNILLYSGSNLFKYTWYFVSDTYLLSFYFNKSSSAPLIDLFWTIAVLPIILILIFWSLYRSNALKFEKDYLI